MKNKILILGIIIVMITTFGCTNQSEKQSNSTNFQMPEGWELHPMPGEGIVIWMGADPRIRIIELKDQQKFDSRYNKSLNLDTDVYAVIKKNRKVEGTDVKVIKTTDNNYGDIQDEYFFQKNNKYYYIVSWAFTGWDNRKQRKSREEIDKAVDTIVKTIN